MNHPSAISAMAMATPTPRPTCSMALNRPAQPIALVPASPCPYPMMNPATAASKPLRTSVGQPTGSEWSWPKQWQSGARPFAIAKPMPATKIRSRTKAPSAPHQAAARGMRAAAAASSARGRRVPSGRAKRDGRPKPSTALREPGRSASLARPAARKTAASSRRADNKNSAMVTTPPRTIRSRHDSIVDSQRLLSPKRNYGRECIQGFD